MFDKLDDLLLRFEEVLNELGEPQVTANQERFQKLMTLIGSGTQHRRRG